MNMRAKVAQALADVVPPPVRPPSPVVTPPPAGEVAPPGPLGGFPVKAEAPLRRSPRAAATVVSFADDTGPAPAEAAASSPAAGLSLLASSSAMGSVAHNHWRPTPPPNPPDPPPVTPVGCTMAEVHETAAAWVVAGCCVPAPPPFPPRACVPTARTPTNFHASMLLTAYAGAEDISSVLRVGEHPSAPAAQVYISRSKIRCRQEGHIALEERRFDAPIRSELYGWHKQRVCVDNPDEGQIAILIRWVLLEKPSELPEDPAKLKERLVVCGWEDRGKASVVSSSPTVGRAPLPVVRALMTEHGWGPRSVDVRTDLLQGMISSVSSRCTSTRCGRRTSRTAFGGRCTRAPTC